MKFLVIALIILPALYATSYAKYNWDKKNKAGVFGILLITILSIILPIVYLSVT